MFKRLLVPLALAGLLVSGQALADPVLKVTEPANGATVGPVKTVKLTYTEPVSLLSMELRHDGKKRRVDVSRVTAAMTLSVRVKAKKPGEYSVQWSGISRTGGHLVSGKLTFTVSE